MGYTHYWRVLAPIAPAKFAALASDAKQLIEDNLTAPLAYEYDEPAKPALFDESAIRFNGLGDDGHETFVITPEETDFEFCKTARKPYDAAVCVVLLLAGKRGLATITSDGNPDDEGWAEAGRITGIDPVDVVNVGRDR